MTPTESTAAERFVSFLHRHRYALLFAVVAHGFLWHYFVLGFMSWDGMTYRVPPVVELVQHGRFGMEKYNQWAFLGYVPFLELVHVPFLYVFGMVGLIIGFPLVVFPLCVVAVYAFVRELTGDLRAAIYGALVYGALPMFNQQPFSGYVDFAVFGLLAFFLYALLRLRTERGVAPMVRLVVATALFTMSRTQGFYVVVLLFPVLAYPLFCTRSGMRVRVVQPWALLRAVAAIAVGVIPSVLVQLWKYQRFGSPTFPLQFKVLGIQIGHAGMTATDYYRFAGVEDDRAATIVRAVRDGWLFHPRWPQDAGFHDSRFMGAGLVVWIALLLLPVFVRRASRLEGWLVVACVGVSVLARDYVHPRWAYTLVLVVVVIISRAVPALLSTRRGRILFWVVNVALFAHLLRPELDLMQLRTKQLVSVRLNVTGSRYYYRTSHAFEVFPDLHARFAIIDTTANGFVLQLYGQKLTNEVVTTVAKDAVGPRCSGLAPLLAREPATLFIDDLDYTKDCDRECVIPAWWGVCSAFRVRPGTAP